MLKSKKSIYILLPVVLGIWGVIGWKIYTTLSGNGTNAHSDIIMNAQTPAVAVSDTFRLLLNYPDPFSGKIESNATPLRNVTNASAVSKQLVITAPSTTANWPNVSYAGLIRKTGSEQQVAMISVNGKSYLVRSGEMAGVLTIGKVWKDSIEVVLGKERRRVRR